MASLNKVSIPTAIPTSSKLDLSCDHVTTMNFGEMQPVHYRHTIKGEKIDLSAAGTVRPAPMACPTYGRMRLNMHHFFVPFRIIFPQFDSFYNDTIGVNASNSSLIDDCPTINNDDIVKLFISTTIPITPYAQNIEATWQSGDPYDFYLNGTTHYIFTEWGKYFFKVLTALGYAVNWDDKDDTSYSALPLLAYAKVYIDYYANQAYLDSQDVIELKKLLAYNDPVTPLNVSQTALAYFFNMIKFVQYDQDYFVGAWDNPFAPNSGQYSAITFGDIVQNSGAPTSITNYSQNANGTPIMIMSGPTGTSLGSQYLHDALKAITDYSKRHQLAGASNINRVLAQFGFGVTALKYDRALHLGGSSIDINTGAVFSTANTAGAGNVSTLGDYAGNGYGNGVSSCSFTADEYGIEISIASILPSGGMFQGMDENNMHIKKLQFFTPEFDGLSTQIIRKREVYVSNNGAYGRVSGNLQYDTAFGWTGRYGEYKRPRSWVSGDLRCPSRFLGGDAWHLMRQFNDSSFVGGVAGQVHGLQFTRFTDNNTFKRIFANTTTDADPFICEFHFNVGSYAPCRGLFETYDFDTENNKKVTLESNSGVLN